NTKHFVEISPANSNARKTTVLCTHFLDSPTSPNSSPMALPGKFSSYLTMPHLSHTTHRRAYCFRGGPRSQIAQTWLEDLTGIKYPRIRGGYKPCEAFCCAP